jgi:very-short-patch-repair endonuclease
MNEEHAVSKQRRNRSELFRDRARDLRSNQNQAEAMVWERLRGRKLSGFKFRRQHPIGNYIADFYCAEAALVVELDGMTHEGREDYDSKREAWLESQGLFVVRITNRDFLDSYHKFFESLASHCVERTKNKAAAPVS